MVMFIYREAYYLSRLEPREGTDEHFKWQEQMDQVSSGTWPTSSSASSATAPSARQALHFNEDLTKFGNLARECCSGPPRGTRSPPARCPTTTRPWHG
jgi:replicative DNA helicase